MSTRSVLSCIQLFEQKAALGRNPASVVRNYKVLVGPRFEENVVYANQVENLARTPQSPGGWDVPNSNVDNSSDNTNNYSQPPTPGNGERADHSDPGNPTNSQMGTDIGGRVGRSNCCPGELNSSGTSGLTQNGSRPPSPVIGERTVGHSEPGGPSNSQKGTDIGGRVGRSNPGELNSSGTSALPQNGSRPPIKPSEQMESSIKTKPLGGRPPSPVIGERIVGQSESGGPSSSQMRTDKGRRAGPSNPGELNSSGTSTLPKNGNRPPRSPKPIESSEKMESLINKNSLPTKSPTTITAKMNIIYKLNKLSSETDPTDSLFEIRNKMRGKQKILADRLKIFVPKKLQNRTKVEKMQDMIDILTRRIQSKDEELQERFNYESELESLRKAELDGLRQKVNDMESERKDMTLEIKAMEERLQNVSLEFVKARKIAEDAIACTEFHAKSFQQFNDSIKSKSSKGMSTTTAPASARAPKGNHPDVLTHTSPRNYVEEFSEEVVGVRSGAELKKSHEDMENFRDDISTIANNKLDEMKIEQKDISLEWKEMEDRLEKANNELEETQQAIKLYLWSTQDFDNSDSSKDASTITTSTSSGTSNGDYATVITRTLPNNDNERATEEVTAVRSDVQWQQGHENVENSTDNIAITANAAHDATVDVVYHIFMLLSSPNFLKKLWESKSEEMVYLRWSSSVNQYRSIYKHKWYNGDGDEHNWVLTPTRPNNHIEGVTEEVMTVRGGVHLLQSYENLEICTHKIAVTVNAAIDVDSMAYAIYNIIFALLSYLDFSKKSCDSESKEMEDWKCPFSLNQHHSIYNYKWYNIHDHEGNCATKFTCDYRACEVDKFNEMFLHLVNDNFAIQRKFNLYTRLRMVSELVQANKFRARRVEQKFYANITESMRNLLKSSIDIKDSYAKDSVDR